MAKLKAYNTGNGGFVARPICDALGFPAHVRQASVMIIAHTKAEAAKLAAEYHCGHPSMSDPEFRMADGPHAESFLAAAGDVPQIFVHELTAREGALVVAVDDAGPRRVGRLMRGEGFGLRFEPDLKSAADLPDGSVVAERNVVYLRRSTPSATRPWHGTDGSEVSDSYIDRELRSGAVVLRVGYGEKGE